VRTFLGIIAVALLCTGFGVVWAGRTLGTPPPPQPALKEYNLMLLSEGIKVIFKGTRIESTGFCSVIYVGEVVDTVVCTSHVLTEADGAATPSSPLAEPPSNAPSFQPNSQARGF
jgi:hypothetical protein